MTPPRRRALPTLLGALALIALASPAGAQHRSILAEVGHLFGDTDRTTYRLGVAGTVRDFPAAGVLSVVGMTGSVRETLVGLGYDLQFGRGLVYFTGGVSAGVAIAGGDFGTWASGAAGFGVLLPLTPRLALQAEGKLRLLTGGRDGGQELAAGLRWHLPRKANPLDPVRR